MLGAIYFTLMVGLYGLAFWLPAIVFVGAFLVPVFIRKSVNIKVGLQPGGDASRGETRS